MESVSYLGYPRLSIRGIDFVLAIGRYDCTKYREEISSSLRELQEINSSSSSPSFVIVRMDYRVNPTKVLVQRTLPSDLDVDSVPLEFEPYTWRKCIRRVATTPNTFIISVISPVGGYLFHISITTIPLASLFEQH